LAVKSAMQKAALSAVRLAVRWAAAMVAHWVDPKAQRLVAKLAC
jgi:hypothetical protein